MTRHRAEHETMMKLCELSAAANPQKVAIVEFRLPDRASSFQPLRPLDLDRGDRKKQRSRKIALASNACLFEGFFGSDVGESLAKAGRRERFDSYKIDRAGHRRLQTVDGKACNGPDAGFARGQLCPVIGFTGTERCYDAHSGDDHDRTAEFIAWCCHNFPRRFRAVLS